MSAPTHTSTHVCVCVRACVCVSSLLAKAIPGATALPTASSIKLDMESPLELVDLRVSV